MAGSTGLEESLDRVVLFLQTAARRLGADGALEAGALVFETCVSEDRSARKKLTAKLASMQGELEEKTQENEQLRGELETALVSHAGFMSSEEDATQLEMERRSNTFLVEELAQATTTEQEACRIRDRCELTLAAAQQYKRPAPAPDELASIAANENIIARLEEASRSHADELQSSLQRHEECEGRRLARTRNEMMECVDQSEKRCRAHEARSEENASQHALIARDAEERLRQMQSLEVAAAQSAERSDCARISEEQKNAKQLTDMRRQHTEMLTEKTKLMRDFHLGQQDELRRTRDLYTECDRAKVRLEIENAAHQRSLKLANEDAHHVIMLRQQVDSLRGRLSGLESTEHAASSLLDETRHRLASLQDSVRDSETSQMATLREKDYRLALLEVQLASMRT